MTGAGLVKESGPDRDDQKRDYAIRPFAPMDADGVVQLYRLIYGEHFPLDKVYDPAWHVEQAESGDVLRVVAVLPDGKVIGTCALFRSVPTNPDLYEMGGMLVQAEYNTWNLPVALFPWQMEILPDRYGMKLLWGEAVCNHRVTQQLSIKGGLIPCGLEVEVLPEQAFKGLAERSQDIGVWVSTLTVYKLLIPEPQEVYLPSAYYDALLRVYAYLLNGDAWERAEDPARIGDPPIRSFKRADFTGEGGSPAEAKTAGNHFQAEGAALVRITVMNTGSDFADWLDELMEREGLQDSRILQVVIPLDRPQSEMAVNALNQRGFWLAGLAPCWYGHDGLILQRLAGIPDFSRIKVYSPAGKEVLNMVMNDYIRIMGDEER